MRRPEHASSISSRSRAATPPSHLTWAVLLRERAPGIRSLYIHVCSVQVYIHYIYIYVVLCVYICTLPSKNMYMYTTYSVV